MREGRTAGVATETERSEKRDAIPGESCDSMRLASRLENFSEPRLWALMQLFRERRRKKPENHKKAKEERETARMSEIGNHRKCQGTRETTRMSKNVFFTFANFSSRSGK